MEILNITIPQGTSSKLSVDKQIQENIILLRALQFQEDTYKMRDDERITVRNEIYKKQLRLNQLQYKIEILQK
jgi:hypothetical protein